MHLSKMKVQQRSIYERCSSLLFEVIGLSPSEREEVETDSGVVVTMEQIRGKAKEIWESLPTLPPQFAD